MEEYLSIYDENNVPTEEIRERNLVHKLGLWHREVCIWIINEKNEVLIQKRAPTKKTGANKWSLCAGHIESKESIIEAAIRETEEEVGIKNISPADLKLVSITKWENKENDIINNHYKYSYILRTNLKQDEFIIQEEELTEVKYVSIDFLKNLTENDKKSFTNVFDKKNIADFENKLKELEEV